METVRGRWFLGEFAKRNRSADTEQILARFDRVETLLREPAGVSPAERVRIDLVEMAKAIAQTRREIAAIKPDSDAKGTLSEASEELGSIVQATERATSDILAAAERIQEVAWTLRERGTDSAICDALDQRATDIYSVCSFQDLTGQRTRKVVDVLHFLEDRIRAMIEIWGGSLPEQDGPPAAVAPHVGEDRTVPHLGQHDIDRMMPSTQPIAPPAAEAVVATARPVEAAAAVETVMMPVAAVVGATALALDLTPMEVARQPEPAPAPEPEPAFEAERTPEPAAPPECAGEPEPALQPERASESDAQPEAVPQLTVQPEPLVAPETAPAAEIEPAVPPDEPRADPAAVLKRILAIIRAPSAPTTPPEVETPSGAADAMPAAAAATEAAVDLSASDAAAVVVAAATPPGGAGSTRPDAAQAPAPQSVFDDAAADDILMPLPSPVTVDEAVDEMLKAPGQVDVAGATAGVEAAAPGPEPATASEPPAAEPVASESEPAVAAGTDRPFAIEVPDFTVARAPTAAPQPELAPEPQPEHVLEPESPPLAEAAPPAEAMAEMAELLLPPEPPPLAASEAPPPVDAVAAPSPPPAETAAVAPAPRYPALAAIAALSDDEKIALFS
jgi:chemotaxis regulatin CheY-phosphate phosphatase CheZ